MERIVSLTIRMPASLHEKIKKFSQEDDKTLNELVRELLKNWLKEREERLLYEAFSMLSEEDVEYTSMAQKEVVLADEKS